MTESSVACPECGYQAKFMESEVLCTEFKVIERKTYDCTRCKKPIYINAEYGKTWEDVVSELKGMDISPEQALVAAILYREGQLDERKVMLSNRREEQDESSSNA